MELNRNFRGNIIAIEGNTNSFQDSKIQNIPVLALENNPQIIEVGKPHPLRDYLVLIITSATMATTLSLHSNNSVQVWRKQKHPALFHFSTNGTEETSKRFMKW